MNNCLRSLIQNCNRRCLLLQLLFLKGGLLINIVSNIIKFGDVWLFFIGGVIFNPKGFLLWWVLKACSHTYETVIFKMITIEVWIILISISNLGIFFLINQTRIILSIGRHTESHSIGSKIILLQNLMRLRISVIRILVVVIAAFYCNTFLQKLLMLI